MVIASQGIVFRFIGTFSVSVVCELGGFGKPALSAHPTFGVASHDFMLRLFLSQFFCAANLGRFTFVYNISLLAGFVTLHLYCNVFLALVSAQLVASFLRLSLIIYTFYPILKT